MANPILVEITRGPVIESRHRGAVSVVDAEGGSVLALGDVERPVYPRSAVKALQALPLIEDGAVDRYGLTEEEIALACASHSGEAAHLAVAAAMLGKAGRDEGALECGVQWPMSETAARALARSGVRPGALHNNCSGKHAGFVCLACAKDDDPAGYVRPDHPVQNRVRAALEDMTGATHDVERMGIDGCSIPTYAVPLPALAFGFARFGTGAGLPAATAQAAARIRGAVARHPFMVAGTGRFDTRVIQLLGERVFVKVGAEGVFCAALPELGFGIALKTDDGSFRAAEVMMAALIARFLPLSAEEEAGLAPLLRPAQTNWTGTRIGEIRPTGALATG
jgi:L-asparaginase II